MRVNNIDSTLKELGLKTKRVKVGFRLHIGFHLNSEDYSMFQRDKIESLIFNDEKTAEETAKQLEQQYKEYYKGDEPYFFYSVYEIVEDVYYK